MPKCSMYKSALLRNLALSWIRPVVDELPLNGIQISGVGRMRRSVGYDGAKFSQNPTANVFYRVCSTWNDHILFYCGGLAVITFYETMNGSVQDQKTREFWYRV